MKVQPTYTAQQVKELCSTIKDIEAIRILAQLIDEEIDLYEGEDMGIIMNASMILFTRSLLIKWL